MTLSAVVLGACRREANSKYMGVDVRVTGQDGTICGDQQGSEKRGFSFAGPTIIYGFMRALCLVNDHTTGRSMAWKCKHQPDDPV